MNILIVDDEISAIEAVQKGIDWDKFAGTSLYTATSFQEAIEHFNQFNIEIMLSDIEMPGGTGLDLLQWVKGNKPNVECIFMTCHADFRFAQKAIQLGSFDYLLKPLNYEEVEEVISNAIVKVREDKFLRKNSGAWLGNKKTILKQFWKDFFVGDISPDKESLLRYIQSKDIGIDIEKNYLPVMVSIKKLSEDFARNEKRLMEFSIVNISEEVFEIEGVNKEVIEFTENTILIMFEMSKFLNNIDITQQISICCKELTKIVKKYFNMKICCYIGTRESICSMPSQIENLQVIDFNNVALQQDIFLLRTYKQRHIEYSNSIFINWVDLIQKNRFRELTCEVKAMLTSQENMKNINRNFLQNFYQDFYLVLISFSAKNSLFLSEFFGDHSSQKLFSNAVNSLDELLDWIDYTINRIKEYVEKNESINNPVEKTKKYIESHISEEISMEAIAQNVHLNPDYLTRIFKKEVGVSISRYIINSKMNVAKKLLIETDLSIGEIALKVGYFNYSSFNRIFTKVVEMSPQQYKISQKNR